MHILYRFYGTTGQLLYIGITMNPPGRWAAHRSDKAWWAEVSGITIEHFATRRELMAAERRAIQIERPTHNVVHNSPQKTAAAPARVSSRDSLIEELREINKWAHGEASQFEVIP